MSRANPVREIEALLGRGIGLDVHTVGSSMVPLAVQNRRRKRGIGSDTEYAKLVTSSPAEFQALVEEVVVPETWFFRDRESFLFLAEWAGAWLSEHPYEVLRILSAPCSSGEEPYSIVMALLGAGISSERFSLEAVDISAAALERARRALYGRNSFRGGGLDFRDSYFQKTAGGWRLNEEVARQVHFRQVNLIDPNFRRKQGELDIIFCRNLLIYFDGESRARVITRMRHILAPSGVLFLGHAEGGLAHEFGFEPIPAPMTFAFRKAPPPGSEPKAGAVAPEHPKPVPVRFPRPVAPPLPVVPPIRPVAMKPSRPVVAAAPAPENPLAKARQLADEGRFEEARAACNEVLKRNGAFAGAYYLLALIEEGGGDETRAEEYYRKTLYIEPDHVEAMVQLSLLEKKHGETETARQLQERARRVQSRLQTRTPPLEPMP